MSQENLLFKTDNEYSQNEILMLANIIYRRIDLYDSGLDKEDFTTDLTQSLYMALEEINLQRNKIWDVNDFIDHLRDNHRYILEHEDFRLAEWANCLPFSNEVFDDKIAQLKTNAINNQIKKVTQGCLLEMSRKPTEVVSLYQKAQEKCNLILIKQKEKHTFSISETIKESLEIAYNNYLNNKSIAGIETGFEDIDHFCGGLVPGKIFGIAAPPGGCKTMVALNMLLNCATKGNKCLIFSLEMDFKTEISYRLLSSLTDIPYSDMALWSFGACPEIELKVVKAAEILDRLPILHSNSYYTTLDKLLSQARTQFYRNPDLKVIFIDHLHELRIEDYKKDDTSLISEIMSRLKDLAQELGVAIVLLCQLSKGSNPKGQRYIPSMRDLKGSSRIEETVNTLIILERMTDCNELKFHCVKNRSGQLFETSHKLNYELAKVYGKTEYGLQL